MGTTTKLPGSDRRAEAQEEMGRLSNPAQRRLSAAEIEQLINGYREAASIDGLARYYEVHRTTVIHHLHRAGVPRRRVVRKMTDESVALAAARYEQGASLALVASELGVHQRTLAREFRRAGRDDSTPPGLAPLTAGLGLEIDPGVSPAGTSGRRIAGRGERLGGSRRLHYRQRCNSPPRACGAQGELRGDLTP